MAITQDDCITAHRAEKRKKASTIPSGAQSPRYCLMQNTAPKALLKNAPSGRWIFRPPSSKEQLDSQCLSNNSSSNSLVQGQMINSSIVGTTTTVVSIVGVPHILLEIALNPRNLFRARTPTRTIKARVRSKLCKSGKGRSTLPPLLNSQRTPQLWWVYFLSLTKLQLHYLILV